MSSERWDVVMGGRPRPPAAAIGGENTVSSDSKFLTFEVHDQTYGLTTGRIREVVPHAPISAVPDVPRFLLGVTSLRHEVIPVVDLKLLFGYSKPTNIDSRTCFIIAMMRLREAEVGGEASRAALTNERTATDLMPVCLTAHRIHSAYRLPEEDIDPAPRIAGRPQVDYVYGLGKTGENLTVLLDVDKLLRPHGAALNRAIAAAERAGTLVAEASNDECTDVAGDDGLTEAQTAHQAAVDAMFGSADIGDGADPEPDAGAGADGFDGNEEADAKAA